MFRILRVFGAQRTPDVPGMFGVPGVFGAPDVLG
jgi:hypothetical protein